MNRSPRPLPARRSPCSAAAGLILLALLLSLIACSSLSLLDSGPHARVYTGQKIPELQLRDARGEAIRLPSLLDRAKKTVVVFYRGYWCPYSQEQLLVLRTRWPDFQARGGQIVAISTDDPPMLAEFAYTIEKEYRSRTQESSAPEGTEFPILLLSDSSREAIRKLGIGEDHPRFGLIARPTTLILDREGTILWLQVGKSASDYPSADTLLRH